MAVASGHFPAGSNPYLPQLASAMSGIGTDPVCFQWLSGSAKKHSSAPDAAGRVGKQEILSVNHERLDTALSPGVAQFQFAILKIVE